MPVDTVPNIPLFHRLPADSREKLLPHLNHSERSYPSGETIVERGHRMEALIILVDGNAHAHITAGDGNPMIVESFRGPDVIAAPILFAPSPQLPVTLIADSRCLVTFLSRRTLLDLAQAHRSVLEALLADAGRRTTFLAARLRLMQFATLRQRIAVYLMEAPPRRDRNGVEYAHIPHSRQELADMFGVARPSLSREIGRMCDDGLIWATGNVMQILDRDALEALAGGCD